MRAICRVEHHALTQKQSPVGTAAHNGRPRLTEWNSRGSLVIPWLQTSRTIVEDNGQQDKRPGSSGPHEQHIHHTIQKTGPQKKYATKIIKCSAHAWLKHITCLRAKIAAHVEPRFKSYSPSCCQMISLEQQPRPPTIRWPLARSPLLRTPPQLKGHFAPSAYLHHPI